MTQETGTHPTQVVDVMVADLRLDPQNPRLPRWVQRTEPDILRWMLDDASLVDLAGSIASQGYFPGEPLLVTPLVTDDRRPPYVVVEGNRRLAAVRVLQNPDLALTRGRSIRALLAGAVPIPAALPCLMFDKRAEILDYLGYRHVTGVQQWSPLAKARYVSELLRAINEPSDQATRTVAKRIGSRSDYVRRLLTGLAIYDEVLDRSFFDLHGVDERNFDFAVLTTALSYAAISEWLGVKASAAEIEHLNRDNLRDLVDWLFRERNTGTTVVGESRNLRLLAAVVRFPTAIQALKQGASLSEAAELSDEPVEAFISTVRQGKTRLTQANELIRRVHGLTDEHVGIVSDVAVLAKDLEVLAENRREAKDEP